MRTKITDEGFSISLTFGEAIELRNQLADLPAKRKPKLRQLDNELGLAQETLNEQAAAKPVAARVSWARRA